MFLDVISQLSVGFLETLKLFAFTLLGAIPLGLIISFGSMSKFFPLKAFVRTIVWIIRGTPLMLQLIIIFYGPGLIGLKGWGGSNADRFLAATVAFVINYACYFSEIYRGGIESVPFGQTEAGLVLGMSKSQIFFKVKLLQVVKNVIPAMGNEIITLVKDTSLARIISVSEILFFGEKYLKKPGILWPLFLTGVYYLLFSGILTVVLSKIEKKLSYIK